eukprot:11719137-Karenia_brevis.AAC.1
MNGRHRAVITANIVAEYLRRLGIKVRVNFLGYMYEGCTPCYPKPYKKANYRSMQPDARGTCGCFQGA